MGKICAVPNCKKLHKTKCSMFKVPPDEIKRKKWAAAMPEIKNLKPSHLICEKHFDTAFIHRKYVKYDEKGNLIAEHVYKYPRLDASAIPNIPANIGSLPFSEDHRYCALSVPESCTSSSLLSVVPQTCAPTMIFSINPLYSATPVPPSTDLRNCTSTEADSVDNQNSASIVPDLMGHANSALSLQSSLYPPVNGIDASPINIDVKAVESSLHGCFDIVEELEKSIEVGACNRPEEKPEKTPRNESFASNFREVEISPASLFLEERHALTVPKSWTVAELVTERGKKMIFSYIITLPVTDDTPALKKSVTLNLWSGEIYYFVHGKILNLDQDRPQLLQVLDKVESLPNILLKFEHMRVCEGIEPIDTFLMKNDGVKDILNYWRSNKCLLSTKYRKCAECKRVQKMFKQRQVRYLKNPALSRIGQASNSLDQNKINILKKKLIRERKMNNRAKHTLKLFCERLETNQKDVAAIRDLSFDEKCQQLNLCGTQKVAVREIIAAAKVKEIGSSLHRKLANTVHAYKHKISRIL